MLHLPSGGGMNKKIAALLGMALALLFATASLYRQVEQMRTEMAGLRQTITGEVTKLGEAVDRKADLIGGVLRGEKKPNTRVARRDRGMDDRQSEDAVLVERLRQAERQP